MKSEKKIEELMCQIMNQYQFAGSLDYDTAEHYVHQRTIMDMCKAAIDILSWVLYDEDVEVDGRLTGACSPEILCEHGDGDLEMYERQIDDIKSLWRLKELREEVQKGLDEFNSGNCVTYTSDDIRKMLGLEDE